MPDFAHRAVLAAAAIISCGLLFPASAQVQTWPAVFDPFVVRTLNLTMDSGDWDTIRFDTTNEIEVPAQFWADDEPAMLVSVRRKSSRALPSETDPVKVGLKIDINEFVGTQQWHGLVKLSLENAGDVPVLYEGMAWQLHQLAANAGFYGPEAYPALANWVRVTINGEYVGVYTSVEQRDTQFLRNRGIRVSGQTWLYEIDDIDSWALESGDPHSPTFAALCYPPFAAAGKGQKAADCATPDDPTLEATLEELIEMNAMLAQAAVDAFSDNPDALFSHGKNFFFADFAHSGLKRRYYPWDLDAVFRSTSGGIYGKVGRRDVTQSPYQNLLLNHPGLRLRYNSILSALVAAEGPLSEAKLHAFLDALEPVLTPALAEDPFADDEPAATFQSLRQWISQRVPNVKSQIEANGPPSPR
ncbi:MAG TPA: CotH kinase family protein [Vicinamibacterales bacterium]|nr:CotH kinase family protein [Vicinamibacterales bacterium]